MSQGGRLTVAVVVGRQLEGGKALCRISHIIGKLRGLLSW